MKKMSSPHILKVLAIGIVDGLLIILILALIAPFFSKDAWEQPQMADGMQVYTGAVEGDGILPTRPNTPTPEPLSITPTPVQSATPMPTATPLPTATPEGFTPASTIIVDGGFIELNISPLRAGVWTQVQWLAGDGKWYDVDGWGGNLTEYNNVLWFVGKAHLGALPPFRWLVYDQENGTLLAASEEFYLPTAVRERIQVEVTLPSSK